MSIIKFIKSRTNKASTNANTNACNDNEDTAEDDANAFDEDVLNVILTKELKLLS